MKKGCHYKSYRYYKNNEMVLQIFISIYLKTQLKQTNKQKNLQEKLHTQKLTPEKLSSAIAIEGLIYKYSHKEKSKEVYWWILPNI